MKLNGKTITIIWTGLLALLLILEACIVFIPHVNSINVASPQLIGQTANSPTDLGEILGQNTTSPTTTPIPSSINAILDAIPIIFVAVIILMAEIWIATHS